MASARNCFADRARIGPRPLASISCPSSVARAAVRTRQGEIRHRTGDTRGRAEWSARGNRTGGPATIQYHKAPMERDGTGWHAPSVRAMTHQPERGDRPVSWPAGRLFSGNGAAKIGRTPDAAGPAGGFAGEGRNPAAPECCRAPWNRSLESIGNRSSSCALTPDITGRVRGQPSQCPGPARRCTSADPGRSSTHQSCATATVHQ